EGELSEEEERRLFEHYGVPYTEEGSVTAEGAPRSEAGDGDGSPLGDAGDRSVGHDVSGPTTDDAMTRSEEELRVGKAQREAGGALPCNRCAPEGGTVALFDARVRPGRSRLGAASTLDPRIQHLSPVAQPAGEQLLQREAELGRIQAAIDAVRSGASRILVIEG